MTRTLGNCGRLVGLAAKKPVRGLGLAVFAATGPLVLTLCSLWAQRHQGRTIILLRMARTFLVLRAIFSAWFLSVVDFANPES